MEAQKQCMNLENLIHREMYLSRIHELLGDFEKAHELAISALTAMEKKEEENTVEVLYGLIAAAYACWRLNEEHEGQFYVGRAEKILRRYYNIDNPDYVTLVSDADDRLKEILSMDASLKNIQGLIVWKSSINCINMELAKDLFLDAYEIREMLGERLAASYSLNNLGNTYMKLMEFEPAIKYFQQSLDIRKSLDNRPGIAASMNSLGRYYDGIGDFEQAKGYHEKCAVMWKEIGNPQFEAKAVRFLGINARYRKDMEQAKIYFDQALQIFNELGNKTDIKMTQDLIDRVDRN